METNAQYVLHDNEATPAAWAARIRLTPELLEKLRQVPEKVWLQLNVVKSDGSSKNCGSNKKTSLLTVKLAETEEKYELLSFSENPDINHVCTFCRRVDVEPVGGYSIYKTGAIHQKLLVQRLLDNTEKDRIKDKHAQSVLASKSRSSKLIDSKPEKNPAKRQRLATRELSVRTSKTSAGSSAWSIAAGDKRTKKLVLPSALTKEEASEAKEKIEKGFEVEMEVLVKEKTSEYDAQEQEIVEASTVVVREKIAAVARDTKSHALFSSDSDDEDGKVSRSRVLQEQKKKTATEVEIDRSATAPKENDQSEDNPVTIAKDHEAKQVLDATRQLKESLSTANASDTAVEVIQLVKNDGNVIQDKQRGEVMDKYALKPIGTSSFGVEVKRARVRSALVSDRVKQSRLPDLSFFPSAVVEICQRVARYHGRSVILDEGDYSSFVEMHEHFWYDWEMLDKAYSIEMIKTEGLHLQLEMGITDTNHEELEARIQASFSKKEGLLFVRDAMASIQKILLSIQTSIDRFDLKRNKYY